MDSLTDSFICWQSNISLVASCDVVRTEAVKCMITTHRFKQFLPVHLHLQLLMIVLLVIFSYFMVEEILLVLEGL